MFGDHHLRPWYKSVEVDGKSREAHCSGPPETAGAVVVLVMASCILYRCVCPIFLDYLYG